MTTDLTARLQAAEHHVAALKREIAGATCAEVGHDWKHIGGRNAGCEILGRDCSCSVPVHECAKCGDCDYGDNAEAKAVMADCTLVEDAQNETAALKARAVEEK